MWFDEVRALALLIAANAVPVIVGKLAGNRWSAPLDFGYVLSDGVRFFGSHKTWRGLICGVIAGATVAVLLGLPLWLGAGFAAVSLVADALSSAIKRRRKLVPGTESLGLDQLGEALAPLLVFTAPLALDFVEILTVASVFIVLDIATAQLRHRRWRR